MSTYTAGGHKSQDALSEVMILVKEEAKTHDLNLLIAVSDCAIVKKGVLVSFQYWFIKVCSRLRDKIATLYTLNLLVAQFHPNSDSYISKLTSVACVASQWAFLIETNSRENAYYAG